MFSQQDSGSKLGLVVSLLRQAGGAGQVSQLVECLKAEFLKIFCTQTRSSEQKAKICCVDEKKIQGLAASH